MLRLTPDQKRIMIILCNAAEKGRAAMLVHTTGFYPIRETTTGAALVRKGLARRCGTSRYFEATDKGYWLGDALRIEDRQNRVPQRRS